jgi:dTDP-4-dehydrorhamnose 3,5-epimerase
MQIDATALPGVFLITPKRFGDSRGWFSESWHASRMAEAGLDLNFVQDNHSYSAHKGTLRGLHFQTPPRAQDKLVRCTRGAILDVAVDYRIGSPHYGKWVGVELSAENGQQLLVPKGFLHGFLTLEDHSEVQYKCTDRYAPECDGNIRWNDPDLAIDWGLKGETPLLSAKDEVAPFLAQAKSQFVWEAPK